MVILKINIIGELQKAFEEFGTIIIQGVPVVILAIVLFVIGYALAKVVSTILGKTLKKIKFDDLAVKLKLEEPLRIIGANKGLSILLSKVVFWLIMMAVVVTTTKRLGIDILTKLVEDIIEFMPKVFIAIIILLIGYVIATKIKEVLVNLTRSLGGNAGSVLGNILYYFIMIMVVITAIDQMGVSTDLISMNILIIVAVVLIAGAVAYGYAAREIMRNMLSSFYSKKNFYEGQRIRIGELEGVILEIDNTSVVLKTKDSKVVLPSSELMSNRIEILEENMDEL
jgi:hypothetical protein